MIAEIHRNAAYAKKAASPVAQGLYNNTDASNAALLHINVYVNVNFGYSFLNGAESHSVQPRHSCSRIRSDGMPETTYSISDLAREFDVTTRTIRFYEEKGLISPAREGQKRLYSAADRVRIKLILRGKRIGMSLQESADVIDLYQPGSGNIQQLSTLIETIEERRQGLLQQKQDIDEMLSGLDEVRDLCEQALATNTPNNTNNRKTRRNASGA